MKITRITLQNFRAFDEPFELDLGGGMNLLLHGENGSGKSSVYMALQRFFVERGVDIATYKNHFGALTRPSQVCLHIKSKNATGREIIEEFRWNEVDGHPLQVPANSAISTISPSQRSELIDGSRRSGFIDYRSILKTHLLSGSLPRSGVNLKIDEMIYGTLPGGIGSQLFDLVSLVVLAGVRVPTHGGATDTIGNLIRNVWANRPLNRRASTLRAANARVNVFADILTAKLKELEKKTNEFLGYFDNIKIEVSFDKVSMAWERESLALAGANLSPNITFRGSPVSGHHEFLNEARLSALATSLFLAGVQLSNNDPENPDRARFIVLDDSLIGLDVDNRQPILRILGSSEFRHYQIVLMTHDRVWFDLAKKHFPTNENWLHIEMLADESTTNLVPRLKASQSDLERARAHLSNGDRMAAAVYARAAFEWKLRNTCEKKGILVKYKRDTNEVGAGDLWDAILIRQRDREKARLTVAPTTQDFILPALEKAVEVMRSTVLNELSHGGGAGLIMSDVRDAIKTVEDLHKWGFPDAMPPKPTAPAAPVLKSVPATVV